MLAHGSNQKRKSDSVVFLGQVLGRRSLTKKVQVPKMEGFVITVPFSFSAVLGGGVSLT